jgi:hypothetical protein
MNRRGFLLRSTAATVGLGTLASTTAKATPPSASTSIGRPTNRIAVSTYSFWRFRADSKLPIEDCIALAADMGFDAVEILEIQMHRKDNRYQLALAGREPGHGQLPGRPLRAVGEDRSQGDLRPREDLLRRRRLVHARPGLRPHRRHVPQAWLPRLHIAGIRGTGGRQDGGAEEPGTVAKGVSYT